MTQAQKNVCIIAVTGEDLITTKWTLDKLKFYQTNMESPV